MQIDVKEFSRRLRLLMEEHDETTYSIADVVGMSAPTISRYMSGKIDNPRSLTIEKLAQHFNVNPAWLMGFDVKKELDFTPVEDYTQNTNIEDLDKNRLIELIAKSFGYDSTLTGEDSEDIELAVEIALAKIKKHKT